MSCNVLITFVRFDYGDDIASSVFELAKELTKRKNKVVIASFGGNMTSEFEKNGIKNYTLSSNEKCKPNLRKSEKELERIIFSEQINIVHSHCTETAKIVSNLQKKLGFPFVMTLHKNIKSVKKYNIQKLITSSESIKNGVRASKKITQNDILVSKDGIKKYFVNFEIKAKTRSKYKIGNDDNVIVCINKLNPKTDLACRCLIDAVEKLDSIVDNIRCFIVGGGKDFEKMKQKAETVNEKLNRKAVVLLGEKKDVYDVLPTADLLVGSKMAVKRASLAGIASIVCSESGYLGLFGENNKAECITDDFSAKGNEALTAEKLSQEIGEYFGLWDEDKEKLADFAKQTIEEYYSINSMTDDAEKIYGMLY